MWTMASQFSSVICSFYRFDYPFNSPQFAVFICTYLFPPFCPCPVASAVCTLFAKSMRVADVPLLGFILVRHVTPSFASPSCPHIRYTHRKYLPSAITPSASASNLSASIVHRPASKSSFYSPNGDPGAAGCSKRLRSSALRVAQVPEQRAHGLGGGRGPRR